MKSKKWMALSVFCIITVFFLGNLDLLITPAEKYANGEIEFVEFRDRVQENYKSDGFLLKNQFVDFNGWFSRLLGKRVINDTVIADNGMLFSVDAPRIEMGLSGQKLANVDAVLKEMGIPFVYVQAPSVIDLKKEILPVGIENFYNENADSLLAELSSRGVESIDLRPEFCATKEDAEKYFFRTDHHWNYYAAFKAFQMLASEIQKILNDRADISMYLNKDNWESHKIHNAFLGSRGRRVGAYVTEVDDYEYYVPKFNTDMTIELVQESVLYKGDFSTCIIRQGVIDDCKRTYRTGVYHAFIGSDYGLVQHVNKIPAVNKKILIIKDSFVLPLQAFLSTVYETVDVIDLRHYEQMNLIEYIYSSKPDIVLMVHNPNALSLIQDYNYGYERYEEIKEYTCSTECELMYSSDEVIIDGWINQDDFATMEFEEKTAYTFEIDRIIVEKGNVSRLIVELYDKERNETVIQKTVGVDTDENGVTKWYFKTPDIDCEKVNLRIYSISNNGLESSFIKVKNTALYKGWKM